MAEPLAPPALESARASAPLPGRGVIFLCRYAGLARGGAERQALLLARRLRERGVDAEVIAEDARERNGETDGSECRILLRTPRVRRASTAVFWGRVASRLWRRRREAGVLHLFGIDSEKVAFVPLARRLGLRTVVKPMLAGEGGDVENIGRGLERRAKLAALRTVDRFVAVSSQIERELADAGVARERIVRVPNGVDIDRFAVSRRAARRALGALVPHDPGDRVVASAGRLVPQKAFGDLLRSFAAASATRPDLRLVVFGEGPEREPLLELAARLGVGGRVAFPGHVADLAPLLAGTDVFVLGSRSEGLSNALLEAMAAGVPVLATRTSGAEDAVRDGVDGRLVETRDADALSRVLGEMADAADRRTQMGEAARRRVRDRFSIEATVEAHQRLYAELVP